MWFLIQSRSKFRSTRHKYTNLCDFYMLELTFCQVDIFTKVYMHIHILVPSKRNEKLKYLFDISTSMPIKSYQRGESGLHIYSTSKWVCG